MKHSEIKMTLSEKFDELHKQLEENQDVADKTVELIENAPESSERDGLRALMYHEGIGYAVDFDKSFEMAEKAIDGGDPLGYFILGYMCDNAETPDQAEGGPRQKYDHYDAERFYTKCAEIESGWRPYAVMWLGDYYMDMAQGGDPEIGVEYYESIADNNAEAAGRLSDYYWDLIMPGYSEDEEWRSKLFKWTSVAVKLDPEEYSYRMGWIYADGFGCEKSREKALEYFEDAYRYGDWRGARTIAKLYEEYIEENPQLDQSEIENMRNEIIRWNNLADALYAEELKNDVDNCIEED